MHTYTAFLRGINVGGHKRLPMADLRAALAANGFAEPKTLLQSGNAVFEHKSAKADTVAKALATLIDAEFGYDVPVIVRTPAELKASLAASPFRETDVVPKWKFVAYLSAAPKPAVVEKVDFDQFAPDEFTVDGAHAYVLLPDGAAKSKLTTNHLEKVFGVQATLRNHSTVEKVIAASAERQK